MIDPKYATAVNATLMSPGIGPGAVDFVLNLQDVAPNKIAANVTVARAALTSIPHLRCGGR